MDVDYHHPFAAADQLAWDREYVECVHSLHLNSHNPLHDPLQVEQPHLFEIETETEDDWQDWFNFENPAPFAATREELLYASTLDVKFRVEQVAVAVRKPGRIQFGRTAASSPKHAADYFATNAG